MKVFVDTAAVMEKPLAASAGLGWQGKHTNLVSRELRLVAVSRRDLHHARAAGRRARGGSLRPLPRLPRRLPDRGVPGALPARCAALHLVSDDRAQGPDPARAAAADRQPHLRLRRLPRGLPVEQVRAGRAATPSSRRARRCRRRGSPSSRGSTMRRSARCSPRSPVKRTGRDRFVRNVLIAIGNSGDPALAAAAQARLDDASPLVRGAAVWALGRLLTGEQFSALAAARSRRETDPLVARRMERRVAPGRRVMATLLCCGLGYCADALRRRIRRALRPHRRHDAHGRTRHCARVGRLRGPQGRDAGVRRRAHRRTRCAPPSATPTPC